MHVYVDVAEDANHDTTIPLSAPDVQLFQVFCGHVAKRQAILAFWMARKFQDTFNLCS